MWDLVRELSKARKRFISLDDPEGDSDFNGDSGGDRYRLHARAARILGSDRPNLEERVVRKQLMAHIWEASERLERQQREVIRGLFFRGERRSEVAERLGVSVYKVDRLRVTAVAEVRKVVRQRLKKPTRASNPS